MTYLLLALACSAAPPTDPDLLDASWRPEGLAQRVWDDASAAWRCAARRGTATGTLAIIDFSLPSDDRRLWVLDLKTSTTLHHERVAHGSGSGSRWAKSFSNESGSHQSSLGLFRGAEIYDGKHGRSLRLDGLEPANSAARSRAIVIHAADYVDDVFVAKHGRAGRSWGCPALDPDIAQDVIDALAGGALLLAWYPDEAWRRSSPWLDCSG